MKLLKSTLKFAYNMSKALIIASILYSSFGYFHTLHRKITTQPVSIKSSKQLSPVIQKAEGISLEDKLDNVLAESIDFVDNLGNKDFEDLVFDQIESDWGYIRGQHLSLEEKINFARSISASLDYNNAANWISQISKKDSFFDALGKFFAGTSEYHKINSMEVDEMIKYKEVVCLQYSKVFAAAFNSINRHSTNPEDIVVGVVSFVPNDNYKHYNKLDYILPAFNAIAFGELNGSIPHAINIVASKDKVYLIEPQWGNNGKDLQKTDFSWETFEVHNKYVNNFKR